MRNIVKKGRHREIFTEREREERRYTVCERE
jgi:hypothetical protein